jgi:4-amino-4-deoxy-L-arabinose transferase-like glycosyltransferase
MRRQTEPRDITGPSEQFRPRWRDALIIFGVALLARMLYLLEAGQQPGFNVFTMDQEYHLEWARGLLSGVWPPPYDSLRGDVYFRAPLYPHFLAGVFHLFGPHALAVRIVQMVIGSVSSALAYGIAVKAFGRRAGLMAGLLCAIYWVLIYFDGELLLPVLQVFFLLSGTLAIFTSVERGSRTLAGLAGLALGLYAITRADILTFLPVALFWLIYATKDMPHRLRMALALFFAIGAFAPPTAVSVRNKIVGDDWVLVASQGGVNYYIGNNPLSNGMQAVVPGTDESWWGGREDTIRIAEEAAGRKLRPSEVSDYWYGRAFAYISAQPGHWLQLTGRKALAMIMDPEIPNNEPYEARRGRYITLRAVPLSFGIIFGLFLVFLPALLRPQGIPSLGLPPREGPRQHFVVFLLLFLLVYALSVIAFFVTGRFRVPLLPFIIMGASATLVWLWDLLRSGSFGRTAVVAVAGLTVILALKTDPLDVRASTRGFAQLSDAQDLVEEGQFGRALTLLEHIRAKRLVNAPQLYGSLVQAYQGRGGPDDDAKMARIIDEGLRHYPDDLYLLRQCTMVNFRTGVLDRAAQCAGLFLEQRPQEIMALYLAAAIAVAGAHRNQALEYYNRAEAIDARHPLVIRMRTLLDSEEH